MGHDGAEVFRIPGEYVDGSATARVAQSVWNDIRSRPLCLFFLFYPSLFDIFVAFSQLDLLFGLVFVCLLEYALNYGSSWKFIHAVDTGRSQCQLWERELFGVLLQITSDT